MGDAGMSPSPIPVPRSRYFVPGNAEGGRSPSYELFFEQTL